MCVCVYIYIYIYISICMYVCMYVYEALSAVVLSMFEDPKAQDAKG